MICDTTFLSDLRRERQRALRGPALAFLAAHRRQPFLVTVISAGEIAVVFELTADARDIPQLLQGATADAGDSAVARHVERGLAHDRVVGWNFVAHDIKRAGPGGEAQRLRFRAAVPGERWLKEKGSYWRIVRAAALDHC